MKPDEQCQVAFLMASQKDLGIGPFDDSATERSKPSDRTKLVSNKTNCKILTTNILYYNFYNTGLVKIIELIQGRLNQDTARAVVLQQQRQHNGQVFCNWK